MTQCNSYETHNTYPNLNTIPLNDHQQFRLNKINEIKDYFVADIKERELTLIWVGGNFTPHSPVGFLFITQKR